MIMAKVPFDKEEQVGRVIAALQNDLRGMVRYEVTILSKTCESPIEVSLAATIIMMDRLDPYMRGNRIILSGPNEVGDYREDRWMIVPQYNWNGYRIDLALRVPDYRFKWLFIECDGHNFHERTKEQAARDRQKDRDIQAAGVPILRFTGSEIHRNLEACAAQVFQFLDDRADDWLPGQEA
jgi:very-short-patch-repair endonuclease